jgi:hypothetical protein
MIGENLIRLELGAPLDWHYGFPSVASLIDRYTQAAAHREVLRSVTSFRVTPPARSRLE